MSYPYQTRRLRRARGAAGFVVALVTLTGLVAPPSAQAVPSPGGVAGTIQTMAGITRNFQQGGYGPEGGLATESQFQNPRGLGFAPNGDLYITDALNHRVRRIDAAGVVHLVAGNGTAGFSGDGGPASAATLNEPHGVAVDTEGNVYIADSKNCVIRRVDTAGIISRFAGTGAKNGNGACTKTAGTPDGNLLDVALDQPKSLFMTRQNSLDTLWVADMGNSQIRRIDLDVPDPRNVRVAGTNQRSHFGGDGGDALSAQLRHPEAVWVASDGTIYVSDGGNNLVRRIAMPVGSSTQRIITTIAGDVAAAQANRFGDDDLSGNSDGDGGTAISAHLDKPRGVAGDNAGNLYIAEEHGSRIRKINLNTGIINTIAGDGTILEQRANGGSAFIRGENGPALETQFALLHDIQINPADGSLWIADSRNNRVRSMFGVSSVSGGNVQSGGNEPVDTTPVSVPGKSGYWALGADGKIFAFGDATQAMFGDPSGLIPSGAKAVHMEPTPTGRGYWITDDRGNVYPFGDATRLGGVTTLLAGERASSLSRTSSGAGYWVFTSKGRVFTFGDAIKYDDLSKVKLNGEILGSIPTPSGKGYYMVGSDGGVFAFGDAAFFGSMGGVKLNQPVMSLVPTRTNKGYWLVASDGGVFAFGDAAFRGSLGAVKLNKPVAGMVRYGAGYMMVGSDGGIFNFSDKPFSGSLGGNPPARPITFAATLDS